MEENEVIFPRIVIHEDVIERHRQDRRLWREGHSYEDEEPHLMKMLREDQSGLHYIDYLRASLREIDGEYAGWIEFLHRHKSLVESGLTNSPNATVRRKHSWLKNYHNAVVDENLANIEPGAVAEDGRSSVSHFTELRIETSRQITTATC